MKGFFYVFGDGEEDEIDSGPRRHGRAAMALLLAPHQRGRGTLHRDGDLDPQRQLSSLPAESPAQPTASTIGRTPECSTSAAGMRWCSATPSAGIHEAVAAGLRPETPLLTHRLADGLALAEAPATSSSYGQHRCRLIARALWRSFAGGCHDRGDRLQTARDSVSARIAWTRGIPTSRPARHSRRSVQRSGRFPARQRPERMASSLRSASASQPVGRSFPFTPGCRDPDRPKPLSVSILGRGRAAVQLDGSLFLGSD